MHIAICDDNANDRKSLRRALRAFAADHALDMEIVSMEDGVVLLAMEPKLLSEIEFFFLDIYMERSNGFNVAKALRAKGVTAPIVFLTSSPDFAVQSYEVEVMSIGILRGIRIFRLKKQTTRLEPEFYSEMLRLSMDYANSQIELVEQEHLADLVCMEQIRKMRHDLKHHLAVLSALLEENDIDSAKAYIKELSGELPQTPLDGKNRLTKGFLKKYAKLCQNGGITFVSDIRYDEDALTDKTRLGLILGNSLQNAYEAALDASEGLRQLKIEGRTVQGMLLLVVENGYDGHINPDYQTTKSGALHGYGLPGIRKAAESMGGYVEIEHTQQKFRLTIALAIEEK